MICHQLKHLRVPSLLSTICTHDPVMMGQRAAVLHRPLQYLQVSGLEEDAAALGDGDAAFRARSNLGRAATAKQVPAKCETNVSSRWEFRISDDAPAIQRRVFAACAADAAAGGGGGGVRRAVLGGGA